MSDETTPARGRPSPATEREIRERAHRLDTLRSHPGWEEMLKEFERRKGRDLKAILNELLSGVRLTPEVQRRIDEARGHDQAIAWVAAIPASATKTVNKALAADAERAADRDA